MGVASHATRRQTPIFHKDPLVPGCPTLHIDSWFSVVVSFSNLYRELEEVAEKIGQATKAIGKVSRQPGTLGEAELFFPWQAGDGTGKSLRTV